MMTANRKFHQILEIVIASSGYTRVILIHVQATGQLFQQVFRNLFVIDETDWFPFFPAFHTFGNLLEYPCP